MGVFTVKKADTHDTPAADYQKIYCKTDGVWYTKNDAGAESPIASQTQGNIVTVAKSGGDYSTITAALTYIGTQTPSTSNRWTVLVYPGLYVEDITMQQYTSIRGMGGPSETILFGVNSSPLVNFDSLSSQTSIINMTLSLAPTAGTTSKIFNIDSGLHAFLNCFFIIASSTNGVTSSFGTMSGGITLVNASLMTYTMTGSSAGNAPHRLLKPSSTAQFAVSVCDVTVNISDVDDDICFVYHTGQPTNHSTLTSNTVHMSANNGSYSGDMCIVNLNGTSEEMFIRGCHFHLESAGDGNGYYAHVDTDSGTGILTSTANFCKVEGFDKNYFALADTGDICNSHFDDFITPDLYTGGGTFNHVNSYANDQC